MSTAPTFRVEFSDGYEFGTFASFEAAERRAMDISDEYDGRVPQITEILDPGVDYRVWQWVGSNRDGDRQFWRTRHTYGIK